MSHPTFTEDVQAELVHARAIHGPIVSHHEAYAVLLEEIEEYWDEVKLKNKNFGRMYAELVQVAAVAQRIVEDLGLSKV